MKKGLIAAAVVVLILGVIGYSVFTSSIASEKKYEEIIKTAIERSNAK